MTTVMWGFLIALGIVAFIVFIVLRIKKISMPALVAKSICIDRNSHLCPVVVSRGNDQVWASFSSPCRGE